MGLEFISNHIDLSKLKKDSFNLISSGTGTGKTKFIVNNFKQQMKEVKNSEILFFVSRTMIARQQAKEINVSRYNIRDINYVKYWNGEKDSIEEIEKAGIQVMTYDKLIYILKSLNKEGFKTLNNIKIIIFDECHTLFSDKFIRDIEILKVWIRDTLYNNEKYIIGMTATPNILFYHQIPWGVSINKLNEKTLVNYKAKQLYCTDFKTIPYLITTQLEGKTIVMCYSIADCEKLKADLPNSFILTSQTNKKNNEQMEIVREYIANYEMLPETFIDDDGVEKELDVLITTSTLREGMNLEEKSGIKNVVCCFSDEMHVVQFAGRCRHNLNALVVVDTYINIDNASPNNYLVKSRALFKNFLNNSENTQWFDNISHIIDHDVGKTIKFALSSNEFRFVNFINKKWLVPKGTLEQELIKYKIYKDKDKNEIIEMVIKCKLLGLYYSQITFNKVIDMMQNTLGYTIISGRSLISNKRHTYKLVIDFTDKNEPMEENNINEDEDII